ncbi:MULTISPECIES: TorD/DmsD family molecular chaperone [Pasteurellaceae]|uniref:TorD/DmsD family molecular chaperone n=1 Tax=Pasteurellaceae TaxID=712 RepID=UPI0035691D9C
MHVEHQLNHFSLISRLFGNLFARAPQDPVLAEVFIWLRQKGLSRVWALETDAQSRQALDSLQMPLDLSALEKEYQRLFGGEHPQVSPTLSAYGLDVAEFVDFRAQRGMPAAESADRFSFVFLTASWIEDNLDSLSAQKALFEHFLLPCATKFLPLVEAKAALPFYRSLARLSTDILSAMADELEESGTE